MYIEINQGLRPYTELARTRGKILIEYEMPNGTTALLVFRESCYEDAIHLSWWRSKAQSYGTLPYYWVKAMIEAETLEDMLMLPQRVSFEKLDLQRIRIDMLAAKARKEVE